MVTCGTFELRGDCLARSSGRGLVSPGGNVDDDFCAMVSTYPSSSLLVSDRAEQGRKLPNSNLY